MFHKIQNALILIRLYKANYSKAFTVNEFIYTRYVCLEVYVFFLPTSRDPSAVNSALKELAVKTFYIFIPKPFSKHSCQK